MEASTSPLMPPSPAPVPAPVRQRIALVLRAGLAGLTLLTLVATAGALAGFWHLTRGLHPVVTEALPSLEQANAMMALVKSIDADARKLPTLEGSFAVETIGAHLNASLTDLRTVVAALPVSVLPEAARAELTQSIDILDSALSRLAALIRERTQQQASLARRIQDLVDLRAQITALGADAPASRPLPRPATTPAAWTAMEASGLLLAAVSSPDPRQVLAFQARFDQLMGQFTGHEPLASQDRATLDLIRDRYRGRLEALRDVFALRLAVLRQDSLVQGSLRRLVVLDRLVHGVGALTQSLGTASLEKTQALEHELTRLARIMLGIAALALAAAVSLMVFVSRRVAGRMVHLQQGMQSHVAGQPLAIETQGSDEIAAMAGSFLHFVEEVHAREARLEAQARDLDQANAALADAYQVISDSIRYASTIQRATLPDETDLGALFPDAFVVWEPRDVVAGDVYWCRRWGDGLLLVVGDCTGHGVPGAFMTLIANGAFNGAILEVPPGDPAALLQRMHQLIQHAMGSGRARPSDDPATPTDGGLDAGACFLNPDTGALIFAGAHFSLFVADGVTVQEIGGKRMGLGYRSLPDTLALENTRVRLSAGMWYYLTTDGLIDQIGGPKRRAFGKARLRALLTEVHPLSTPRRKATIQAALARFQGREPRRDDVCLVGFGGFGPGASLDEADALRMEDSLLTGVGEIDQDHLKLFDLVNRIGGLISADRGSPRLVRALEDLVSYTHWHFRHEERLMLETDFPGRTQHKREHEILVDQASHLLDRLEAGDLAVCDGLMTFLGDWLRIHIKVMDKEFGNFLLTAQKATPMPSPVLGTPAGPISPPGQKAVS
ncbi:bacteriohemerythrin [Pararhodospirillum oryzae]|uniref:HAMP domain-containing protein n=1 Tax=Pararhodospirillum oryzae TaxID=478448 RepID=A0A512H8U5_9PROT|nr:bacteriohemerythrin [Pararhodospirillum oryzae]GEO81838.1 hypothetical protein ROR02_19690 [Pararhodospirillum oryzae]